MKINFNEKKVKELENSKAREKSFKYKVDTKQAIILLLSGLGFGFLSLIIRAGVARIIAASGAIYSFINAVRHFSGANYNSIQQACKSSSISFEELERDFEGALNYNETPCMIGNRYMIIGGNVYSFDHICWAFYGYHSFNNNGAKGKNGVITVCIDDGSVAACVMKENKAAAFIDEVAQKHPETVLGYSYELEKLFRTNISEFKNLSGSMRPDSIYEAKSDDID